MSYSLEIEKRCEENIKRLTRKNRSLEMALEKAILKILENPDHFKPLRWPLQNMRRVHVLGSFVLIYEIKVNPDTIRLLRFTHHDDAYKQ